MIGVELAHSPNASALEKLYIRVLGVPISGLRIRMRRVKPFLTGNPERVLDAGCGRGVFSYELAKTFPHASVVGVDIDTEQVALNNRIAGSANLSNLEFQVQDIAALPYREEFDFVVSIDNLEHLEDDDKGLRCLHDALKPGGRLVLHVPGYQRRWYLFRFTTNFDVPGHFRPGYRLEEIVRKIEHTGFVVDHSQYTYGWLETVTNNISYLITRAEAKNRLIYALAFPLLNAIAWLGRHAKPVNGAGVLVTATK